MVSSTASAWSSESSNRAISLGAASALPSLLRMIRIASSRFLKTIAKPSRMWIRASRFSQLELQPPRDDLKPKIEEVLKNRLQVEPARDRDLGPVRRQQAGQVDAVVDL